jgi:hypothetical protein
MLSAPAERGNRAKFSVCDFAGSTLICARPANDPTANGPKHPIEPIGWMGDLSDSERVLLRAPERRKIDPFEQRESSELGGLAALDDRLDDSG